MFKSLYVHYSNKYPGSQIKMSEASFDVFSGSEHLISIVKNGAGQVVDRSEELGCSERHDLSPIPKQSRRMKLYKDGKIGPAEEYVERSAWVERNSKKHQKGYSFVQPGEYEGVKEEVKDEAPKPVQEEPIKEQSPADQAV